MDLYDTDVNMFELEDDVIDAFKLFGHLFVPFSLNQISQEIANVIEQYSDTAFKLA